jgi:dihydrofolate synthase/folylpolyglutamate synthase
MGGRLTQQTSSPVSISNYQYWFRPHTISRNTIEAIAGEKAGITKLNVPVVIGEYTPETKAVFTAKAKKSSAIYFASELISENPF